MHDENAITDMAKRGATLDQRAATAIGDMPGEKAVSVNKMAAHYMMMNYDQRTVLFREILVMHGPVEGLSLIRKVFHVAATSFSENPGRA